MRCFVRVESVVESRSYGIMPAPGSTRTAPSSASLRKLFVARVTSSSFISTTTATAARLRSARVGTIGAAMQFCKLQYTAVKNADTVMLSIRCVILFARQV
jgi:hypothetical protein